MGSGSASSVTQLGVSPGRPRPAARAGREGPGKGIVAGGSSSNAARRGRVQAQDGLQLPELPGVERQGPLVEPADPLGVMLIAQVDRQPAIAALRQRNLEPLVRLRAGDRGQNRPVGHPGLRVRPDPLTVHAIEIQCQRHRGYQVLASGQWRRAFFLEDAEEAGWWPGPCACGSLISDGSRRGRGAKPGALDRLRVLTERNRAR